MLLYMIKIMSFHIQFYLFVSCFKFYLLYTQCLIESISLRANKQKFGYKIRRYLEQTWSWISVCKENVFFFSRPAMCVLPKTYFFSQYQPRIWVKCKSITTSTKNYWSDQNYVCMQYIISLANTLLPFIGMMTV